jgi:hypothetical protein
VCLVNFTVYRAPPNFPSMLASSHLIKIYSTFLSLLHKNYLWRNHPIPSGAELHATEESGKNIEIKASEKIIGSLLYIAQMTQPDILFAVTFIG